MTKLEVKEESSFLKKRSKRFLIVWYGVRCCRAAQPQTYKSLFASFSSEKEDSSWPFSLT